MLAKPKANRYSVPVVCATFFFLLLTVPSLWGQSPEGTFHGPWEVSFGAVSGPAAATLDLPANTGSVNPTRESDIWLSNTFSASVSGREELYLDLGKIEAAVMVYLNGDFIGSSGSFPPHAYFSGGRYKRFVLPAAMLLTGSPNTVKLHLYNDSGNVPLRNISIIALPPNNFFPHLVELLNIHLFLAFSLLSLFIGLFYLLQYVFQSKERTNLFFALANLALFLYFLELGIGMRLFPFVLLKLIAKSSLTLFFSFLTIFFVEYIGIFNYRWLKTAVLGLGGVFFVLFYIFARTTEEIMSFFTLSLIAGGIDLIIMAVVSVIGVLRKNREARLVALGVLFGIGSAVHDFYYQFSGNEPLAWMQGIGILLFDVCVFISLALRSIQMQRRLEEYTAEVADKRRALGQYVEHIEAVSTTVSNATGRLNDDIQSASSSFQRLSQNSDGITQDTQKQFTVVQEIDTTTRELLESLEGTYRRLDSQNRDIHETSATIEQMLANLEGVTLNLKETADFTKELESITEKGQQTVLSSTRAIEAVKETSQSIYEVIDAVNNLSEQTNLLSINAGIEAAHAGSAGEGFAVVAGEIKKLAEASSRRAQEVYSHIESIIQRIDEGVEVNSRVRELLGDINRNTARAAQQINSIYMVTMEQRSASEAIKRSLESLQDSSQEIKSHTDRQSTRGKNIEDNLEQLLASSRRVMDNIESIGSENYAILRRVESIQSLSNESSLAMNKLSGLIRETRKAESES